MTRLQKTVMAIFAALLLACAANAQVSLDSVRIEAKDTVALAKFYQAAFGMQEVNRIENPGGTEVFVNSALKAAGGTMTGDPRPFRNTGIVLGFAMDPAGNRIELIQRP
jgi:predicted enzyme related to lactoylglutathione lyase